MVTPIAKQPVLMAQRMLSRNQADSMRTTMRLATGRRINSGKDDPAGLISSEQLAAELKSLEAQTRSLRRHDSFARISEGHTSELSGLMSELNGLVIASANSAGLTDGEVAANQMQIDNILGSIQRVSGASGASLDGFSMPDGGTAAVKALVSGAAAAVTSLGSGGANSLASGNFAAAQTAVQTAITDVATARGRIGAYQKYDVAPNIRSNQIAFENLSESRSRIADTDFALETSNLARLNVLTTSNMMTLNIAQQQGQSVLALLTRN